jgi:hypothetical protein
VTTAGDGVDERRIEDELKAMALRVERRTNGSTNVGCVGALLAIVACFYFGGLAIGFGGGIVLFLASFVIAAAYDEALIRRTAREFHARYPEGSRERPVALLVLAELESTGKSLDKLRNEIRSPDGAVITRRRSEAVEPLGKPADAKPLLPVELLPAEPPAASKPRARPNAPVMPLEPFEPEPRDEAADERDPGTRRRD